MDGRPDHDRREAVELAQVRAACARREHRRTAGIEDMPAYLSRQVGDGSHREGGAASCGASRPAVAAQSHDGPGDTPSGTTWAYNDVRVNLRCLEPCRVRPDYGYLGWLNDRRSVPDAPASGRCARGNGGATCCGSIRSGTW